MKGSFISIYAFMPLLAFVYLTVEVKGVCSPLCDSPSGNSKFGGDAAGNSIISGASNVLLGGFDNDMDHTNLVANGASNTILGGQGNRMYDAQGSAIITCFNCEIDSSGVDGVVFGGGSTILGGRENKVSSSFGNVMGGIANEITANYAYTIGSFGRVNHSDRPAHRCSSMGENTVHICSNEEEGVYVNDINLIAELNSLRAELSNLTESILPECTTGSDGSRRRLQVDCYTNFPTHSPSLSPTPAYENPTNTEITNFLILDNARRGGSSPFWPALQMEALYNALYRSKNQVCATSPESIQADIRAELENLGAPQDVVLDFDLAKATELKKVLECPAAPVDLLPIIAISVATTGVTLAFLTFIGLNKSVQERVGCSGSSEKRSPRIDAEGGAKAQLLKLEA